MILGVSEAVILFHVVLASMLKCLEGPKYFSQRAGTGLAAGPELSLGLPLLHMAVQAFSQQGG